MNGTRISSTFDGRCVKTIVRTSPNRAASRAAASADNAGQDVGAEEDARRAAPGRAPNRTWNQNAMRLWMTNPPREGVEREQHRQPEHDPPRLGGGPAGSRTARRRCRPGTSTAGERQREHRPRAATPTSGVADDHRAVARRAAPGRRPDSDLRDDARRPAPRRRSRTSRRGCTRRRRRRPLRSADDLRERRLLDGQERPDLVAARADDADRRGDEQHDEVGASTAKTTPATDHQHAPTISTRRRPSRSACVVSQSEIAASPEQRQREQQPDLARREARSPRDTGPARRRGSRSRTSAARGSRTAARRRGWACLRPPDHRAGHGAPRIRAHVASGRPQERPLVRWLDTLLYRYYIPA